MSKIQRALISVSDKTGIVDFARKLHGMGVEILSTGGTARLLGDNGIPVTEVSDYTGFPEMMDGRVKTLHPKIHGGLLGRRGEDEQVMRQHAIEPIDLVVVNLYPFEQTVAKPGCDLADRNRKHRYRRADHAARRSQEPCLCHRARRCRRLRIGTGRNAGKPRRGLGRHPLRPGHENLRAHGPLRRRNRQLSRRHRRRRQTAGLSQHLQRTIPDGASAALRREPPSTGRVLRRTGTGGSLGVDRQSDSGKRTVIQ